MNRHDFSVAYAKRAGITQEASAKTCEEVFDLLFDCIGTHDRVYIKGLGTFYPRDEETSQSWQSEWRLSHHYPRKRWHQISPISRHNRRSA